MAKNGKGFLYGTLFGTIAGGFAALIFAKKSGKEFRKDVSNAANEAYDKAGSAFNYVGKKAKSIVKKFGIRK